MTTTKKKPAATVEGGETEAGRKEAPPQPKRQTRFLNEPSDEALAEFARLIYERAAGIR